MTAYIIAHLDKDKRFTVFPLDRRVIERSNELISINEMHDRQIVATVLILSDLGDPVRLLTRDANIRASGQITVV